MKKIIYSLFAILLVSSISAVTYWKFQKETTKNIKKDAYAINIADPIYGVAKTDVDLILGNLDSDKVKISVNKGAFANDQEISIVTPKNIPESEINSQLANSPIEIFAGEKPVRLNEKTIIEFKFDSTILPQETKDYQMQVAYYNGEKWDYIRPLMVDMEKGIMTFETYHFSLLAPKISNETKVTEKWIHSQALDNVIRSSSNDASDEITDQIISMTLGKMGIEDDDMQKKVFEKMASAEKYKEIHDLYKSGDIEGASQKIAILAGEKIVEVVPDSMWKGALENVIGGADDVAKVSQAAGYAAEGQYKEAAKIIGENIADKFLITTAGKIATEAINGQIDAWKNEEVDAAYQAYKKGADGYFWGYNVDKGNFEEVWDQMRGIRRQLEVEGIAKENEIRTNGGMPRLSEKEEFLVRERIKNSYKRQFIDREKKEEIIAKEEDKLKKIFDAYKKADMLSSVLGPAGLDKGYGYEEKLAILNHFAQKIMKDTNRLEISDKDGMIMETKISLSDIVMGAKKYFSEPDGKKQYEDYLKERFGIGLYPSLKDLAGAWDGSMTITDIIVSDEYKNKAQNGQGEEGCDLIKLDELKGKTNPLKFDLKPNGESGGMFVPKGDSDIKAMPFTYNNGEIEIPLNQDKAEGRMFFKAEKSESGEFTMTGSMYIDYAGGQIKIRGNTSAKK